MPAIPTLPQGDPCSTIGALGLNFRVRNGIGWIPRAIVTGKVTEGSRMLSPAIGPQPEKGCEIEDRVDELPSRGQALGDGKPNGQLVRVSYTHCCAYTSRLSTR